MTETTSDAIRSPFYPLHADLGATFVEEGGWFWTEGFGDTLGEHDAVRNDLGVWDVSPLNKWDFRGSDALAAAQRLHSGDVLGLEIGQVRYGAFCDEDGLMIDDGTVYRLADDHVWVMTNGSDHAEHFAGATKGLNVGIAYVAAEMPHIGLLGPRAREALAPLTDVDLSSLRYFHFVPEPVTVGGVPCHLSRTGFGGELGYELFVRPEHAADIWAVATDQAKARPFGTNAIEVLRIEAGLIVTDYDYEAHQRSPYDFSFDRLITRNPAADYLGKAALQSVAANPPNRFKTLRLEGSELPEYGAAVTRDGAEVGTLTSPTDSPEFGPIGIGVLRSDVARDGEQVDVAIGDATVRATVDVLPVYDPQKLRPRS
ncbi:MAG TPA: aminomethyltransferase family protein [Actinomycetota bacterium]